MHHLDDQNCIYRKNLLNLFNPGSDNNNPKARLLLLIIEVINKN